MKRLLVCVLLLTGCSVIQPITHPTASREGRAAAERRIAEGSGSIRYIGLPGPYSAGLDEKTGLPLGSAGCVYSAETWARVEAYNARLRLAAQRGEVPTFRDQRTTVGRVRALFAESAGTRLVLDGPRVTSPDGGTEFGLRPRYGDPTWHPYLFAVSAAEDEPDDLYFATGEDVRVAFIHDGRTLVLRDGHPEVPVATLHTFDVRTRRLLQTFSDR